MLATEDEDDDLFHARADPDKVKDMGEAKRLYVRLRQEQRRMEVYQQNLQKKLQRLKVDLDVRTEEVEGLQRSLVLEQRKYEDAATSLQREHEQKAKAQDERIRDVLSEVLYTKPTQPVKVDYDLDTVLVSFLRPQDNFRYNLAFRVDNETSVVELRGSACRYWGIAPGDFVLKTMAGNKCQDLLLVKDCFKQGEIAQLRLERKSWRPTERPTDDELKAIQPKVVKKKRRQQTDNAGVSSIQKQHDNYSMEMRRMGGVYFLLKTQASKPSEHASKIKLRDLVIYSVMVVLTFVAYNARRPAGHDYWFRRGFEVQLERETFVPGTNARIPPFVNLTTHDDLWKWLTYALPDVLLEQDMGIGYSNLPLGYAAIRVQTVSTPDPLANCEHNVWVVGNLTGASCDPVWVDEDTEMTADQTDLQAYWEGRVAAEVGEEPASRLLGPAQPWSWRSASQNEKERGIGIVSGTLDVYSPSGYTAEFRMATTGKSSFYRDTMLELRSLGWISQLSRMVLISFTAYNFDYDKWMACSLLVELPPSGVLLTSYTLTPFRPNVMETKSELSEAYFDYVRVLIAFYILIFVGISERRHKIKNHKAGCWYHVLLCGVCDLGIVVCVLGACIWRAQGLNSDSTEYFLDLALDSSRTHGFTSLSSKASTYANIFCLEGLLMVFLMYRMLTFVRLIRTVRLFWHTLGRAFKAMLFFACLFVPLVAGFTVIANSVYGPYLEGFSLVTSSFLEIYRLLEGDMDVEVLEQVDLYWAVGIIVIFYVVISFLLFGIFAAIVVDAYYVTHITRGGPGEKWSTRQRIRWFVPGVFLSIYHAMTAEGSVEAM